MNNKFDTKEILAKAESVFGSRPKALSWLKSPSLALGGKSPNELLKEGGHQLVIDELNRIEYGIYS